LWQKATSFHLPPRETEEGRGGRRRRLADGPGPRWWMGQGSAGVRSPLDFGGEGPQGGEPWRRVEDVSGRRGGGVVGPGGGRSYGEKGEGTKGVLSPTLAQAGAQRGGGSAVAGVLEAAEMAVAVVLGSWREGTLWRRCWWWPRAARRCYLYARRGSGAVVAIGEAGERCGRLKWCSASRSGAARDSRRRRDGSSREST
jgi:hypothetical protein